jgi:beta propeller repeat protein
MKKKLFISLIISFITVLAYNVQAQAETNITQVTSNNYEDSFPCINGDYLVWQAYVSGDWEVFLYDISGDTTTPITNNSYNDISPQTDGEYVVWFGSTNQGGEIFLYEILSGITKQISSNTDTNVYSPPQIANGLVVWASHEVSGSIEPGEIILYNIETQTKQQLTTTNSLDNSSPKINNESVVWVQIDEDDNSTLYIYPLPNGPTQEAPEGFIWADSPQTDGDLTVSMRNDSNDWEIIVREDGEKGVVQITNNTVNDRYPRISGDNIAWMAGEGHTSEIYIAQYTAADECKGDLDGDGVVDMQDWLKFGEGWGRTDCGTPPGSGDPPNNCDCDLNDDGTCDMADWLLFGEDWGRTDCPR